MSEHVAAIRVLLVTPVLQGTGETLTAMRVAGDLQQLGASVAFLATPLARRLVQPQIEAPWWPLGEDAADNRRAWDRALAEFKPTMVVFADYPLMFFPSGSAPLARESGWVQSLEHVDAALVTFDHFGFGQGERSMFLGPSHLGFFALYELPALPARMHVLLPCPMHEPGPVAGRQGTPFRLWDLPLDLDPSHRTAIRQEHLGERGGKLVVHSVPGWALQGARELKLPLYEYLPEIFERYLGHFDTPITMVSVNDGHLLRNTSRTQLRIRNLDTLSASDFEALLLSADLFLTENGLSISMGKALCAGIPCGALINSARAIDLIRGRDTWISVLVTQMERERVGAVYPWEVFPSVVPADVERIGLYRENRIVHAFARVETFGGAASAQQLEALLFDEFARSDLMSSQSSYRVSVAALTTAASALYGIANA
jgi:hypothetical protein